MDRHLTFHQGKIKSLIADWAATMRASVLALLRQSIAEQSREKHIQRIARPRHYSKEYSSSKEANKLYIGKCLYTT